MRNVQVECSADNLAGIIFVLKNKDIIRIYKKKKWLWRVFCRSQRAI